MACNISRKLIHDERGTLKQWGKVDCLKYVLETPSLFGQKKKEIPAVGLHSTDLQALYLPSLQREEQSGDSTRIISSLLDRGYHTSKAKDPGVTPHCTWLAGHGSNLHHLRGEGGYHLWGMTWSVTRETVAGAGGKHVGSYWLSPVIKRIGYSCEWARPWSRAGRGWCTESKRTAILGGMTIYHTYIPCWTLIILVQLSSMISLGSGM